MLSKLRLAFSHSPHHPSTQSNDNDNGVGISASAGNSTSLGSSSSLDKSSSRTRSNTVPHINAVPHSASASSPSSSSPSISLPLPSAASPSSSNDNNNISPGGASTSTSISPSVPIPPAGASSPSASSSGNHTPLATPSSINFPSVPFSTPATPPRAMTASGSPLGSALGSNALAGNALALPTPNTPNARKKTKSTATLPSWIVSSFSSSSPKKEKEQSQQQQQQYTPQQAYSQHQQQQQIPHQQYHQYPSLQVNPALLPPLAVPSPFPLQIDVSRRGSLPMSPLAVDSSSSRPRSPSSPYTPIRIDRPPLKAPSPLSTASSPYQFIDESDALPSPSLTSPVDSHATSSKPNRRKSILGKRRNFTQVWNGYSSTMSLNTTLTSPGDNTSRDVNTRQAGAFSNNNDNKKKGNKNHQNSTSSTETRHDPSNSEDYSSSSLLAASKRVFSKSVDDLSSFTKASLLSSPINYSRPRKSVDERRITQTYHPPFSASPTSSNNASYGFSNMQSGFTHKRPNNGTDPAEEEELDDISTGSSTSLAHSLMPSDDSLSSSIPPSFPRNHHPTHHIFKVPKLPSLPSSKHSVSSSTSSTASASASASASAPSSLQNGKKEHKQKSASKHRKASSSFAQRSVQLPPSISLPGGLCIESTASILASSMEEDIPANPSSFLDFSNEIMSSVPQGSLEGRNGTEITNNIENQKKRKSMDGRSVKSDTILLTSPGLAPPFKLSTTLSSKSAPSPTFNPSPSKPSSSPLSSSPSGTSSFPKRPPLASRKSSGNASNGSTKSNATARFPSFGSPKSSPLALDGQSDSNPNLSSNAAGSRPTMPGRQRSSQIILIEGFLQRKTDHRSHIKASSWSFPFSSSSGGSIFSSSSSNTASSASATPGKSSEPQFNSLRRPSPGRSNSEANIREVDLSKGWKPFYAILRGTNLYLYKLSSDLSWQAKTCFSNYTTTRSVPSTTSLSSSSTRMPSTFAPSTPCQATSSLNEDKVKASISNSAKAAYLLPIANSTVRLIHSATRGDVFELVTEEGEVAILQTGDKEETDKWMQILSNTGTSIANKRASYLETIGKLDIGNALAEKRLQPDTIQERKSESYDRPMPGQANSVQQHNSRLFGMSLEELVRREGSKIPRLAEALFKEIESRGLLETGIYRVPGENRVMQATKAKLNAGAEVDFATDPSFSDPHNLASLVKLWLRELPEIISPTFYDSFIQANNIEGYEERLCAIRDLIWSLPATSFHLLDRLCEHLHLIAEHELENQMHASNLAIVFAPTILRPPEGSDSYAILMSNLGKAAKLVSSLIVQHHWIFSGQETEEATEADAVAGAVEEHLKEGQAGGEQPGGSAPNAEDNPHQQSASISRGQQEEVGRGAPSDGVEEGSSSHRPPVTA